MDGDVLTAMARDILERTVTEAAALNLTLPSRQYITVGGATFDCEQVSVSAMSVNTGMVQATGEGLDLIGGCPPVWSAPFELAIVVCANEKMEGARGQLAPAVSGIESDAETMSKAVAVIANVAESMALPFGNVRCSIQLGEPQGGLIAAIGTITANLWASAAPPGP